MEQFTRVGVCAILIQNNEVLLGKRKGSHGEGTWGFPGGHLEFNEEIEECLKREVKEEIGVEILITSKKTFTNDFFKKENKHYITIFIVCKIKSGEIKLLEPNKCEEWKWFSWDDLPKPLFLPIENLKKEDFNPFD